MAAPLGNQRSLEVGLRSRAGVIDRICKLESTFNVLAGSFPVALPAIATSAPVEDVDTEAIAREFRPLSEIERLRKQGDRGLRTRALVPVNAKPEEHVCTIDVREARGLGKLAGLFQNW